MFSPEEMERDCYQRRQLAIRDDIARREDALTQGRQEGRREGALVERVLLFESLLNLPPSDRAELYELPLHEIQQRADELEREFRQNGNRNVPGSRN